MHLKERMHQILFTRDTRLSRTVDLCIIIIIFFATLFVMLDSVAQLRMAYAQFFFIAEVIITIFFTIEYIIRVWASKIRKDYVLSFYGIIDLLAILPLYIMYLVPGAQGFLVIRVLRFLRVFRTLKLVSFLEQETYLFVGIKRSLPKIMVFMFSLVLVAIIAGALMYIIEPNNLEFSNMFQGVYWGVVTLTTVGYGDVVPVTVLGKTIASILMILGYGIIAVPTGLVTVDLHHAHREHHHKKMENKLLSAVESMKRQHRRALEGKTKTQKKKRSKK